MKRFLLLACVLGALAVLAVPAGASAHPLGNFTTNRYSEIHVAGDHVYVLYVLDLAEIPTFQARDEVARRGERGYAERLARTIARGAELRVSGTPVPLRVVRDAIGFPLGVAGLHTTRLEVLLDGGTLPGRAGASIDYRDSTFSNRIGWKEIVVRAEAGASVTRSSAPAKTISEQLRAYPKDLLQSPLDVTRVSATVVSGPAAGAPPRLASGSELRSPVRVASTTDTGFASLIAREELSPLVLLAAAFIALFWGAAHALTPGHGKSLVAAYLIGTRGRPRDAIVLGVTVTVTHTLGVFALGFVTLALSQFVVPEQLYPWLNLVSALLVVGLGVTVLRLRLRAWRGSHHHHEHGHHEHVHQAGGSGVRGVIAMGISGGLLPCPTALVVLLAAISLHRLGYGLLLIASFSLGLAGAITAIGLVAVTAKSFFSRRSFEGRLLRMLPSISALAVLGLGVAMTLRALPKVV